MPEIEIEGPGYTEKCEFKEDEPSTPEQQIP
jgi:hypothetical protein